MIAQPSQPPILETRDLTRTFGHGDQIVRAVDRVSFSVQPGEIVCIVGESGSGKSTLGRLLLRLMDPTGGRILLHGTDITQLRSSHDLKAYWRKVQAVFQDPFSAFNQFYSNAQVLGRSLDVMERRPSREERLARTVDALKEVGLDPEDTLFKYPHQLSGGQVQRVMIARVR